jgi:hypothetical protein
MDQLILKRASASRTSGEWREDDYDVVADGVVVGRIMRAAAPCLIRRVAGVRAISKILTPPEFEREYEGELVIARVSPRGLAAACPSAKPGHVVLGCARPGRGRCEVRSSTTTCCGPWAGLTRSCLRTRSRTVWVGPPITLGVSAPADLAGRG